MNLETTSPRPARPHTGTGFGQSAPSQLSRQWAALTDVGAVVCSLTGQTAEAADNTIRNFPALVRKAGPVRCEQAEIAVTDLLAVMEPGIAALLAISARGGDPAPAAAALWREFVDARSAVLALLPPAGDLGPRRSA